MAQQQAFAAFSKSHFAEAIEYFDKLVEKNPQDSLSLLNRALCYFHLQLYRKAFQDCNTAITANPKNERAFLLKGMIQSKIGKKDLALQTWQAGSKICVDLALHSELLEYVSKGYHGSSLATPVSSAQPAKATPQSTVLPRDSRPQFKQPQKGPTLSPSVINSDQFDAIAQAAVGQIQHGVGDIKVDKFIALGYYHINSGAIKEGMKIFDELLTAHPKLVAAYLGRGTGHALEGAFDEAIVDFSMAIQCDPGCVDAYKRRGQTRAARGFIEGAFEDFDKSVQMQPDAESFRQRGLIYYRKAASKIDHQDASTWNHMGLCYDSLGDCRQSVDCHRKALSMDPQMKEAWVNLGQAYKDWGKYPESLECYNKALAIDPRYGHAYHLKGVTEHAVGHHFQAQLDLDKGYMFTRDRDCSVYCAVTKNALGMYGPAAASYDTVLAMDPKNACWYQKEVMLWNQQRLDKPWDSFNADAELDPEFKEFFCKRHPPQMLKTYKQQPPLSKTIPDVVYSPKPPSPEAEIIVKYSAWYGKMLHNSAPGYLSNARQQRMAALAAFDLAQRLRGYWFHGETTVPGAASSLHRKPHTFNWRDMFDVVIRWRQISEPNDPVWWVDVLTKEQFAEGFGSHTPMITGQCNVVRYSPMVAVSFPIMKAEIINQKNLSDNMKKKVLAAKDVQELYEVMRRDFWVVTPCLSTRTGSIMEGTRLTLQYSDPDGYEFSIRTPGTPPRWIDYDEELNYIFGLLTAEVQGAKNQDRISELILTISFYWFNFMPLARGTAACGVITMTAMFLAVGIKLNQMVPEKCLLDWEGILRPNPTDFTNALKPWMWPARTPINMEEFDKLPNSQKTFPTLRKVIEGLNCVVD